MGHILKICTFNVRNDNLIPDLTTEMIRANYHKLLVSYGIDILCTQELIESTMKIIREYFPKHHILGDYRYGKGRLVKKIKTLKKYNEANAIITPFSVINTKTYSLPWIPRSMKEIYNGIFKYRSLTPRIITLSNLKVPQEIVVVNTHLDCHIESIKNIQLKKVEKILKRQTNPIILTGDFNTDKDDPIFTRFIAMLNQLGLKRVEYDQKTFAKSKKEAAIDHIFIPNSWKIRKIEAIKDRKLEHYSDHYPIYVEVEIPEEEKN